MSDETADRWLRDRLRHLALRLEVLAEDLPKNWEKRKLLAAVRRLEKEVGDAEDSR